jgi:hypothetical protein
MASALYELLKFFPRFHPPNCPGQFEPLLAVARVIRIARIIRIKRPERQCLSALARIVAVQEQKVS